jgi:hypothetical protein
MKPILATVLLSMAYLATPSSANAQDGMKATIPFDFTVGQQLLPQGQYAITYSRPQVLELYNSERRARIFVPTFRSDVVSRKPKILTFKRYGDRYFLSQVRGALGGYALNVYPSKHERNILREQAVAGDQRGAEVALK